jgi:hypothetical protein
MGVLKLIVRLPGIPANQGKGGNLRRSLLKDQVDAAATKKFDSGSLKLLWGIARE